jgi:4-amino-4-deoxy-L-arabinose transferase-like glycosyltransferase
MKTSSTSDTRLQQPNAKTRVYRYGSLLVIFFAALFFRAGGLSHDLDLGNVYHPDTPKQMWAADEFMQGRFFHETGNRDFDGYPFFNSLITAKVTTAMTRVIDGFHRYTGSERKSFAETPNLLFWVTRYINALLSALAVCMLFLIARMMYSDAVGWIAAVFLTLSPVDIAACHYATGDTAAAFFALPALIFAIRVYKDGRWFDYMLGTFFCICSFSSKYHGALTVLPLLLAHLFRYPHPKQLFSIKSLSQGALVIAAAVVTFFITTAGAMQEPLKTIQQIIGFMQYTSNFHLPQEVVEMNFLGRFIYSMKLNLPVFAELLGPLLFTFSFVGLFSPIFLRRKQDWLIVSLPLVYIIWGLTSKPASHPVYHALIIPQLILIGSYMFYRLITLKRYASRAKIAGLLLAAGAALYLLNYAGRELFFFQQRDTRVLAQRWIAENVPAGYRTLGSRYSCIPDSLQTDPGPFSGIAWVRCDCRERPEKGDPKLLEIDIDKQSMVFRNYYTEIYLAATDQIKEHHAMPIFQWIASEFDTELILDDAKTFYRNTHIVNVDGYAKRTIITKKPLESILVAAKSLPQSTRVKVKLTTGKKVWHLKDNDSGWIMFENLRPNLMPRLRERYAYKVEMFSGRERPAQISLGITPLEKGVLFYQMGEYLQAAEWLLKAEETKKNPTLQAMELISRILAKQDMPSETTERYHPFGGRTALTDDDIAKLYGITPEFLNRLPYIKIPPQEMRYEEYFRVMADPQVEKDLALYTRESSNEVRIVSTDSLALPPGSYNVELKCKAQPGSSAAEPIICRMVDSDSATVAEAMAIADGLNQDRYTAIKFKLIKPYAPPAVNIQLTLPPELKISIADISIRPDPQATLKTIKKRLDEVVYK